LLSLRRGLNPMTQPHTCAIDITALGYAYCLPYPRIRRIRWYFVISLSVAKTIATVLVSSSLDHGLI